MIFEARRLFTNLIIAISLVGCSNSMIGKSLENEIVEPLSDSNISCSYREAARMAIDETLKELLINDWTRPDPQKLCKEALLKLHYKFIHGKFLLSNKYMETLSGEYASWINAYRAHHDVLKEMGNTNFLEFRNQLRVSLHHLKRVFDSLHNDAIRQYAEPIYEWVAIRFPLRVERFRSIGTASVSELEQLMYEWTSQSVRYLTSCCNLNSDHEAEWIRTLAGLDHIVPHARNGLYVSAYKNELIGDYFEKIQCVAVYRDMVKRNLQKRRESSDDVVASFQNELADLRNCPWEYSLESLVDRFSVRLGNQREMERIWENELGIDHIPLE
jgi:hypothetical protein